MANPVGFECANVLMLAAENMSSDECCDLPVYRDEHHIISCWRLTDDELETITETGVIWISVLGQGMPPVCVAAGSALIKVDGREPKAEPYIKPARRKEGQQ